MIVGVIGGSQIKNKKIYNQAYDTGSLIAKNNWILVCGGLGGVMEAAAKGAYEHHGLTIGILPQTETNKANPYIKIPIATGMGLARNYIIVHTADVLVAIDGEYGTLNEITAGLSLKKTVLALDSWNLKKIKNIHYRLFIPVKTPEQAIQYIIENIQVLEGTK